MRYPSLELIDFQCREIVKADFADRHNLYLTGGLDLDMVVRLEMFCQTWSNTATGFDLDGGLSGQMFVDEYTTVATVFIRGNNVEKVYVVCFGESIAYIVRKPNEKFFRDLKNRNMYSQKYSYLYEKEDDKCNCS